MNVAAPNERPQKWDWKKWLSNLVLAKGYHRPEPIWYMRKYRVYIDNTFAMFLGEVCSNMGFYSVYEDACNLFPQYADTITIIDCDSLQVM